MRTLRRFLAAALLLAGAGCHTTGSSTVARVDPPALVAAGKAVDEDQNPVYLPLGPQSYGPVFETVLQVLGDYGFEIQESNRYDGRVEALPRVAPGLALFLKPGSPDLRDRLLATLQTYRHRVTVIIQPADHGGYFVEVIARKELEDLYRPLRSTVGGAVFRTDNNVERQYEVIDASYYDAQWIFRGRDVPLEQELIRRLKRAL